jgi:mRNA-degrading endonuclease toxin of MazEF toxin-antitoxin module
MANRSCVIILNDQIIAQPQAVVACSVVQDTAVTAKVLVTVKQL